MRVLLVMARDDARSGGSFRVGQSLLRALRSAEVDAHAAFAYGGKGPVAWQEGSERCHYLGLSNSRNVRAWPAARALLRDLRPEIVHYIDPLLWMKVATLTMGTLNVVHVHGAIPTDLPLRSADRFRWWFLRRTTDHFVCITEGARRSHIQSSLLSAERTAVVYNGVDANWFDDRPERATARRDLGIPPDKMVIGMLCRLVEARGCDDFIRILKVLDPRWHGLLVGDGPDRARLEDLARHLGVRSRLTFAGNLDDVRPAYSAMDAFAYLALYDSFGMATAEAMLCRVPVFGIHGTGEYNEPENPLVTTDKTVFASRPRIRLKFGQDEDPLTLAEIAGRINDFGKNPGELSELVERAHQHVRQKFTTGTQAAAMLMLYTKLLSDGRR